MCGGYGVRLGEELRVLQERGEEQAQHMHTHQRHCGYLWSLQSLDGDEPHHDSGQHLAVTGF